MATHIVDTLSLGKIVQIRERLFKVAASGTKVCRLESGDPSFEPPAHVIEAIAAAARAGKTHYVPNAGIPELRAALAHKARHVNGIPVASNENVFVTHGAMHALFATFHVLLDEGDEVIIPDPMWTEVAENIRLARGRAVAVPLRYEDDYEYDPAAIEAAINVPFAVPAARMRMWADLTMGRYGRQFAGKDRRTRDVALLEEITADLQR